MIYLYYICAINLMIKVISIIIKAHKNYNYGYY